MKTLSMQISFINRVQFLMMLCGAFFLALSGCSPDLGEAPFRCHSGEPKCPDGYECNSANLCVEEGTCPEGVEGCSAVVCGNGSCETGEDCRNCEVDCGKCTSTCGDGTCGSSEDCSSCPVDCGKCDPVCGDGTCEGDEDASSCPQDCSATSCGNGICETGETETNCPADCKAAPVCGNGTCESGEDETNCPADCKAASVCGNGTCESGEDETNCPADCKAASVCGNGTCESGEDETNCPADCKAASVCGNGTCESGEDETNCPADCKAAPVCGDGTCDSTETPTSCPQDCECVNDLTGCVDDDTLRVCQDGKWQTNTCSDVCVLGGYDFAVKCDLSSTGTKYTCLCGDYGQFGDACSQDVPCDPAFYCGVETGETIGFCTKDCNPIGSYCTGATGYTEAECYDDGSGSGICVFTCDGFYVDCPDDLTCDLYYGVCVP